MNAFIVAYYAMPGSTKSPKSFFLGLWEVRKHVHMALKLVTLLQKVH